MGFIERFKQRQIVNPIVTFEHSGITFQVARFAREELEAGMRKGAKMVREQGIDIDSLQSGDGALYLGSCWGIAEYVARHVKGWTAPKELEMPQYSKAVWDSIFSEFDTAERATFGAAYLSAAADTEKKTEGGANSVSSSVEESNTP